MPGDQPASNRHPILVIGIGDSGPACLPESLAQTIMAADLLCGGERHLAFLSEYCGERLEIKSPLEPVFERLGMAHQANQSVVVLASGDPCCFGIGPLLSERLGRDAVRIIPGVSSVQLLFARLGEPWQGARILSAHGRPIDPLIGGALSAHRAAILTDETNTPSVIAAALREAGMQDCRAAVGERLGGADERIFEGTLSDVLCRQFDPLSILVLVRDVPGIGMPRIGLSDHAYAHRDGMITKAELRAVSISKLGLRDGAIVWDIGAGCGSVGLEAASLVGSGTIYAVERDESQVELLRENLARFPSPLRIVAAEAPDGLAMLPDPWSIFIGGSGGHLEQIIDVAKRRLRPGGRFVANFALLEHLVECRRQLTEASWEIEITQLASSRGVSTAGALRLEALNPIFVLAATRPAEEPR